MTTLLIYEPLRTVKHLNFILNILIHLQLLKVSKQLSYANKRTQTPSRLICYTRIAQKVIILNAKRPFQYCNFQLL